MLQICRCRNASDQLLRTENMMNFSAEKMSFRFSISFPSFFCCEKNLIQNIFLSFCCLKHKNRNKLSQRLSNGAWVRAVCHQLYIRQFGAVDGWPRLPSRPPATNSRRIVGFSLRFQDMSASLHAFCAIREIRFSLNGAFLPLKKSFGVWWEVSVSCNGPCTKIASACSSNCCFPSVK